MQTKVPASAATQRQATAAVRPESLLASPTVLQSKDLLGTRHIVDIEHNGQRYRLQATKAGKLILTK